VLEGVQQLQQETDCFDLAFQLVRPIGRHGIPA
jgi:hypothetical protein